MRNIWVMRCRLLKKTFLGSITYTIFTICSKSPGEKKGDRRSSVVFFSQLKVLSVTDLKRPLKIKERAVIK